MKKFIFIFAALFLGLSQVSAQEIYVENFTAPEGGVMKFDVKYRGIEGKTIQGYIFKFEFPEGLSLVTEETEEEEEEGGAIFEFGEDNPNTKFDVKTTATGVQASPSSKTSKLSGSEGTLLTLTLKVNDPLAQGDVATVKVYDASLTEKVENTDGTSSFKDLDTDPFTFDVTIVEDRVIFNETDTKLPAYTAGEKKNVRMTRTMTAGKWNTVVLPFTLTANNLKIAFGEGAQYAYFSGWSAVYDFDNENYTPQSIEIKFTTKSISPNIPGGIAFLVNPSKDVTEFEFDNVTLTDVINDNSDIEKHKNTRADENGTSGVFKGTFVKTKVPNNGLFISDEKFYYSKESNKNGLTNIKGFRGWFELGAVLDQDTDFGAKISFTVDGESTLIEGFNTQRIIEGVYDLSGRKIQIEGNDLNKLQKGVYIIDGKKVTIK